MTGNSSEFFRLPLPIAIGIKACLPVGRGAAKAIIVIPTKEETQGLVLRDEKMLKSATGEGLIFFVRSSGVET